MTRELTPEEKIETLAKPMLEFIAKVDRGEARSVRSYGAFIQALKTAGVEVPGHD